MELSKENDKLLNDIDKLCKAGQTTNEMAQTLKINANFAGALRKLLGYSYMRAAINVFARIVNNHKEGSFVRVPLHLVELAFDFSTPNAGTKWRVSEAKGNKVTIEFEE